MGHIELKLIDTEGQQHVGYQMEGDGGLVKGKGATYMVTEDDLTLGDSHTMKHTGHVS